MLCSVPISKLSFPRKLYEAKNRTRQAFVASGKPFPVEDITVQCILDSWRTWNAHLYLQQNWTNMSFNAFLKRNILIVTFRLKSILLVAYRSAKLSCKLLLVYSVEHFARFVVAQIWQDAIELILVLVIPITILWKAEIQTNRSHNWIIVGGLTYQICSDLETFSRFDGILCFFRASTFCAFIRESLYIPCQGSNAEGHHPGYTNRKVLNTFDV